MFYASSKGLSVFADPTALVEYIERDMDQKAVPLFYTNVGQVVWLTDVKANVNRIDFTISEDGIANSEIQRTMREHDIDSADTTLEIKVLDPVTVADLGTLNPFITNHIIRGDEDVADAINGVGEKQTLILEHFQLQNQQLEKIVPKIDEMMSLVSDTRKVYLSMQTLITSSIVQYAKTASELMHEEISLGATLDDLVEHERSLSTALAAIERFESLIAGFNQSLSALGVSAPLLSELSNKIDGAVNNIGSMKRLLVVEETVKTMSSVLGDLVHTKGVNANF